MTFRRVLLLSPHPDDAEYGAGALVRALTTQEAEVHYRAFSLCRESLPEGDTERLRTESLACLERLGVCECKAKYYDFPVRRFPEYRQDILETLVRLRRQTCPDLVLCPAPTDRHQDHGVVCREAERAFPQATVLGYLFPWNNQAARALAFHRFDRDALGAKVEALRCFRTQHHRAYMAPEAIEAVARSAGLTAGAEFAESFDVLRLHL